LSDRQRKPSGKGTTDKKAAGGKLPARKRGALSGPGDVGKALRSVYDKALNEDVPADFLDLLGKLD
jgi:hypothetical protein